MTPADLAAAARVLLGRDDWQRPLARKLTLPGRDRRGIDSRLIRRWMTEGEVPEWVEPQLKALAAERQKELEALR